MWNTECLAENVKILMNNESTKAKVDTNMYYMHVSDHVNEVLLPKTASLSHI